MNGKAPMCYTILLLSSDPVIRIVIREALEKTGYVVLAAGDLGVAVDRMNESKPDLLIIHPYIESMSGHDAAKYLHTRCPDMRILMVSSLIDDDRLKYRAELEHFEIFPKPIAARDLVAKVGQMLA